MTKKSLQALLDFIVSLELSEDELKWLEDKLMEYKESRKAKESESECLNAKNGNSK